jgi:hypothetical protein
MVSAVSLWDRVSMMTGFLCPHFLISFYITRFPAYLIQARSLSSGHLASRRISSQFLQNGSVVMSLIPSIEAVGASHGLARHDLLAAC